MSSGTGGSQVWWNGATWQAETFHKLYDEKGLDREELLVTAPASESTRLIEVVRALEDGGIDAHDVRRRESTLDDVFFSLTSPRARAAANSDDHNSTDREEAAA